MTSLSFYSSTCAKTPDTLNNMETYKRDAPQTLNSSAAMKTSFKFPTIEERVKYYMGSWYEKNLTVPTSAESALCKDLYRASSNSRIDSSKVVLYSFTDLQKRHQMPKSWLSVYLKDVTNVLTFVESKVNQGEEEEKYIMLQIGDEFSLDHNKPVIAKSRGYEIEKEGQEEYYKPIIWPLHIERHFSPIWELSKINQTQWSEKKDEVVWRGSCTGLTRLISPGVRLVFVAKHKDNTHNGVDVALTGGKCPGKSKLVDIRPDQSFYREHMDMEETLRYKYLLNLEGNDASTGLKWMLGSNSVVFMPPPTALTFAMESMLVPYVHYVPVKRDGSDLLSQLEWAKKNDEKCRWISEQATKYIENLWTSDQAQKDWIVIKHMMGNMYHNKFSQALAVCFSGCPVNKRCSG